MKDSYIVEKDYDSYKQKLESLLRNKELNDDNSAHQHQSDKLRYETELNKQKITSDEYEVKKNPINKLQEELDKMRNQIWIYPSSCSKRDLNNDDEIQTCQAL